MTVRRTPAAATPQRPSVRRVPPSPSVHAEPAAAPPLARTKPAEEGSSAGRSTRSGQAVVQPRLRPRPSPLRRHRRRSDRSWAPSCGGRAREPPPLLARPRHVRFLRARPTEHRRPRLVLIHGARTGGPGARTGDSAPAPAPAAAAPTPAAEERAPAAEERAVEQTPRLLRSARRAQPAPRVSLCPNRGPTTPEQASHVRPAHLPARRRRALPRRARSRRRRSAAEPRASVQREEAPKVESSSSAVRAASSAVRSCAARQRRPRRLSRLRRRLRLRVARSPAVSRARRGRRTRLPLRNGPSWHAVRSRPPRPPHRAPRRDPSCRAAEAGPYQRAL